MFCHFPWLSEASAKNGCDQKEVGAEQRGPQPGARTTESDSRVVEEHPRACALDVGFGERNWWGGHTPVEFDLSGQQCLRICQRNGFAFVQTVSN